jgi:hypothetical protein
MLRLAVHLLDETSPLLPGATRVFVWAILPLVRSPYLHLFNAPIARLVECFSEGKAGCAIVLIRVITRDFWRSLPWNQSVILLHLGVALRYAPPRVLAAWAEPLAKLLAQASKSLSEVVAQAAAALWCREGGCRLLAAQKKVIIPIVVPAISHSMTSHWSAAVREAARNTMVAFQNAAAFLVSKTFKEAAIPTEDNRVGTWYRLTQTARARGSDAKIIGDFREPPYRTAARAISFGPSRLPHVLADTFPTVNIARAFSVEASVATM